jgi:kumamolisin
MDERHVVLGGSERPPKSGATRIGEVDRDQRVEVTVSLRGPELPDANSLPSHGLSRAEFDARYGASPQDADTVARVLGRYGLKVDEVSLPTRSMQVSGTVAELDAAFKARLAMYRSADQGEYRGREGVLQVPAELEGIVTGVFGLDERRVARRKADAVSQALAPLTPTDLEQRYRFPQGDGGGERIAIAEFGGDYLPDDLQAFCAKHGRPVPDVRIVPVNLRPGQGDRRATPEVMMDVEIVAGLCSGAQISLYFATFDQKGWVDLLNRVIQDQPISVGISWGLAEDHPDWSAAARRAINERLSAAATLGITVCVSSGDDGSGDQMGDSRAHADFPSSSPFVLSVGGTMITATPSGEVEETWWVEPGFRDGHGGGSTGGGVSVEFQRPSWQDVSVPSVNPRAIDGRVMPDVAALAGPPFYDLTLFGEDAPNGGTSASAPLWASLVARVDASLPPGDRQRFLTPLLYQAGPDGHPRGSTGCRDMTRGQNVSTPPGVGYQAGRGYDAVTGWGTPDGVALLQSLG